MKKNKKLMISLVISVATLSILGVMMSYQGEKVDEKEINEVITQSVQILIVQEIDYQDTIEAFARVDAENKISVNAQVRETLNSLYFKEGDQIKSGEIVAELDMGNLHENKSYLEYKKNELIIERRALIELNKNNQTSKLSLAKIEAQIKKIESDIKSNTLNIEKRKIKSTITGTVNEINFKQGEVVDTSKVFVEIIGKATTISAQIHARDLNKIKIGHKIKFTNNIVKSSGIVSMISKKVSNKNNTIKVDAILEDDMKYSQMSGKMIIKTDEVKAMKIPASSVLLDSDNDMSIFIIKNKKAKSVKINIIKNNGNEIWIKPLMKEMKVVTVGQFYLKNNVSVEVGENIL